MAYEFINEIEKQKRTCFTVSSIPVSVLKEFKKFCFEECGDIYWVGILQLLKSKEMFEQLLTQFASLQNQINELKSEPKGERKRFG